MVGGGRVRCVLVTSGIGESGTRGDWDWVKSVLVMCVFCGEVGCVCGELVRGVIDQGVMWVYGEVVRCVTCDEVRGEVGTGAVVNCDVVTSVVRKRMTSVLFDEVSYVVGVEVTLAVVLHLCAVTTVDMTSCRKKMKCFVNNFNSPCIVMQLIGMQAKFRKTSSTKTLEILLAA